MYYPQCQNVILSKKKIGKGDVFNAPFDSRWTTIIFGKIVTLFSTIFIKRIFGKLGFIKRQQKFSGTD
ncbi:hypothetical protein ABB10_26990 [Bacillus thuringiensis]|nr:hypothetical protein [Bacillus thuringiensis]MBG9669426.1 hypothetical protein [Bacillus thuringiensis]MBH0355701.1 hypothetical protein [Bacillus thuringiensis]